MYPCVVHVGLTKAASTAVQEFFRAHPDIHLPDLWHTCNHLVPKSDLLYDPAAVSAYFQTEGAEAAREHKLLVLSHERLGGSPHSGHYDVSAIAYRIRALFPNARIVLCIREQMSMLASCYKQFVRAGGVATLRDYLLPMWDHRIPRFEWTFYRYDRLIAFYRGLFGEENVQVLLFEELRRDAASFFGDLCEYMRLPLPNAFDYERVINEGIPDSEILKTRYENFFSDTVFSVRDRNIFCDHPMVTRLLRWYTGLAGGNDTSFASVTQTRELFAGKFTESNRVTGTMLVRDLGVLGYEI